MENANLVHISLIYIIYMSYSQWQTAGFSKVEAMKSEVTTSSCSTVSLIW